MKILHALERSTRMESAIHLMHALKFREPQVSLVHVLQRMDPLLSEQELTSSTDLITRFLKLQEEEAHRELELASRLYQTVGISAESTLLTGFTSSALVAEASKRASDLIVVSPRERSALERILTESVAASLLHNAPTSILVVKGEFPAGAVVRAVLATDHSEYCNKAIDALLRFAPQGIAELGIVTAFSNPLRRALTALPPADAEAQTICWKTSLAERNSLMMKRLSSIPTKIRSSVSTTSPVETILGAIKESSANLLILGAQGHGFLERLTIGSISHELLMESPCSVLVLRAAEWTSGQ